MLYKQTKYYCKSAFTHTKDSAMLESNMSVV